MRRRRFGSLDVEVPVIGLGTWNMEPDRRIHRALRTPHAKHDARARCIEAIHRALELGMTHVDTAEYYGNGEVETLVGEALAGRRDEVFLVSKVLPSHASYDGTLRACEASLRRLRTDHLDVYLLHWRGDLPLEPTFRAFEELRAQGKVRAWGVSNFDEASLDETLAIVGEGKLACNQVLYHLGERTIEHGVIPWCERHGVAVVAYSPLGSTDGFPRSRPLEAVAQRLGATPRQVALAFLTRRPGVFAIPKSANAAHVAELATEVKLDDAAIAELERAFPLTPWRGLQMI